MKNKYHFKAILCASFAILLSFHGIAQQSAFFTPTTSQNISSSRQQYVSRLAESPATERIRYVRFADLPQQLTPDGRLFLNLSTEARHLEFRPIHYELKANGDYEWYGKNTRINAYVSLIKMQDRLVGFMRSDTEFWEIVPLKEDVSMIREMDTSMMQSEQCGVDAMFEDYPLSERVSNTDLCNGGGCAGTIDILVLIPPDVMAWYGTQSSNPWAPFIHMVNTFAQFELALINSGVGDISLRYHVASFDFSYDPSGEIGTDLNNLSVVAANIRNEFRADLVVMLTSMDYFDTSGRALASEIVDGEVEFSAPREDLAFAIVEVEHSLQHLVFPHEIGHLFGARHNRSPDVPCNNCGDDNNTCAHGLRFSAIANHPEGQDRTIMAQLFDSHISFGAMRALHFSNPDIQFNGFDTGTEDDNNTRVIQNGACIVRNHQPSREMDVTILGEHLWCPLSNEDFPYIYSANVNPPVAGLPGVPPYTYEWRYNANGNFTATNPGALLGTGTSVSLNTVPVCPQFFLKLSVTSSDGITQSATRVISTTSCTDCSPDFLRTSREDSSNSDMHNNHIINDERTAYLSDFSNNYRIFPNPFSSNLHIERQTNEHIPFTVTIFDITGKVVYQTMNTSQSVLNIDLNKYADGIFTIQITDKYNVVTHKIIKVQK